jgi:hypothetical protein
LVHNAYNNNFSKTLSYKKTRPDRQAGFSFSRSRDNKAPFEDCAKNPDQGEGKRMPATS